MVKQLIERKIKTVSCIFEHLPFNLASLSLSPHDWLTVFHKKFLNKIYSIVDKKIFRVLNSFTA